MTTYATWNPADKGANATLSGGNLSIVTYANSSARATVGVSSGKWYWEITRTAGLDALAGVGSATAAVFASGGSAYPGADAQGWSYYSNDGSKFHSGSSSAYGAAWAIGAVVGVALDMDAGTLTFYKNGVSQGVAATGLTGTMYPMIGGASNGGTSSASANFGATAFAYSVPSGFNAGIFIPGLTATGFSSTQFGTPKLIPAAVGFTSTAFGTPHLVPSAVGFISTQFGAPRLVTVVGQASGAAPSTAFGSPRIFPYGAAGFKPTLFGAARIFPYGGGGFRLTQFGAPVGQQHWRAHALGPTTRFGVPATPTNRTQLASGWVVTGLGAPTAVRSSALDLRQAGIALGFRAVHMGLPTAAPTITCAATALTTGAFGTPTARVGQRCAATSLGQTATFGTPATASGAHAVGFQSTRFGAPAVRRTQTAAGFGPACRFGTPRQWGPHIAYSFGSTRFGQPRSSNRINHPASGFSSTHLGTPSALNQRLRVASIAPGTRLGRPLLVRDPLCPYHFTGHATSLGVVLHFGAPRA